MTATHNHAPVCCCVFQPEDPCPACPKHGTLAAPPVTEAQCGFRCLDNLDLICTYQPHPVDKPHSWQDGGDPRGWRNAIDPNRP